jgi:hypothetical protein
MGIFTKRWIECFSILTQNGKFVIEKGGSPLKILDLTTKNSKP